MAIDLDEYPSSEWDIVSVSGFKRSVRQWLNFLEDHPERKLLITRYRKPYRVIMSKDELNRRLSVIPSDQIPAYFR